MKKVLLFLVSVLAVSFMACEGPMGPPGMDGYDGRDGKDGKDGYGTNWLSRTFTIQPNEWELVGKADELNSFFRVKKDLPELTQDIYREKAVIAYVQAENGVKNGMPWVLHQGVFDNEGYKFLWTETYDFDYATGYVRFYLTYSDFSTQIEPLPTTFHIVLMW